MIYILTGYRIGYTTFKDWFQSIFVIHNETVNIWTHLFGVVLYSLLTYYTYALIPTVEELKADAWHQGYITIFHKYLVTEILGYDLDGMSDENSSRVPIIVHFFGGALWMACSTAHHCFMCHSEGVFQFYFKWDSLGILFGSLGMNLTMNYYIFYCPQTFYIAYIYIILANVISVLLAIMTFHPLFHQTAYRPLRVWAFIIFGVICTSGVFHTLIFEDPLYSYGAASLWLSGNWIMILGSHIYVLKIPERFFPKTFDLIGQSHNLWHCIILFASLIHCCASFSMYYDRLKRVWPSNS